jgi:C4-dicarboxylate-specific signal transduction histidine kinase
MSGVGLSGGFVARALVCLLAVIVGVAVVGLFSSAWERMYEQRGGGLSAETRGVLFIAGVSILQSVLSVAVLVQWRRRLAAETTLVIAEEADRHRRRLHLAHLTRVAMMGQLSAALAHELTQPLTAILSSAQAARRFLDRELPDRAELMEILDDIVSYDERAADLIERVRTLCREERDIQPVDVGALVREVLAVMRTDLAVRHVHARSCRNEPVDAVWCDRVQIQQVLSNLLENAAEAMSGREPRQRHVEIDIVRTGDYVRICVADSGTGIGRDQLKQVFEPFYTTKRDGLGLGLAICRSIVQLHGGKLWAASDGRHGAAFHFTLPLAKCSRVESQLDRGPMGELATSGFCSQPG